MNFGISQQDPDKSSVTITPKITIKPGEDSGFQKIQKPNISNGRNFTSIDSKESLIADKASQVLIAEQHESSSTEEEKEFKKDLENAVIFSGEGDTLIAEKVTKMTDLRKIMQAQRENRIGYVYKKEDGSVEIEAQGHMLSQIEQAESVEYQTARGTKTFTNFSGRELTEDQVGQLNISTRVYLVFLAHQEENQVNASGEDLRAAQSAVDSEGVSEAEGFDGLDGLEKPEAAEPSTSSSSSVEEGEQSIEELGAEEINDDLGEVDDDDPFGEEFSDDSDDMLIEEHLNEARVLETDDRVLETDDRVLETNDQVLETNDQVLKTNDQVLETDDQVLGEIDQVLEINEIVTEDKQIEEVKVVETRTEKKGQIVAEDKEIVEIERTKRANVIDTATEMEKKVLTEKKIITETKHSNKSDIIKTKTNKSFDETNEITDKNLNVINNNFYKFTKSVFERKEIKFDLIKLKSVIVNTIKPNIHVSGKNMFAALKEIIKETARESGHPLTDEEIDQILNEFKVEFKEFYKTQIKYIIFQNQTMENGKRNENANDRDVDIFQNNQNKESLKNRKIEAKDYFSEFPADKMHVKEALKSIFMEVLKKSIGDDEIREKILEEKEKLFQMIISREILQEELKQGIIKNSALTHEIMKKIIFNQ